MAIVYRGKRVFITGASSGIGAELARQFAAEGALVALAARREKRLEALQKEIEDAGGTAIRVACDVTSEESVRGAVARVVEEFGGVDVAIANAGFGVSGAFWELGVEDWRRQFETNFFGVLETAYAVLPHLMESKGQLAIMASVMGRMGAPLTSAYCASKFALVGLAESIYYELEAQGVSVSWINPGLVASDIRRTDNEGILHEHAKEPAPSWIVMPTGKAVRAMIRGLRRRRPEITVTGHGKLAAWMARHFPRTLRFLMRVSSRNRLDKVREAKRSV